MRTESCIARDITQSAQEFVNEAYHCLLLFNTPDLQEVIIHKPRSGPRAVNEAIGHQFEQIGLLVMNMESEIGLGDTDGATEVEMRHI
jgi:hypothetical protein